MKKEKTMLEGREKTTFNELMGYSLEDLTSQIVQGKETLFRFRLQKREGEIKPHEIKRLRRQIARLKTARTTKIFNGQEGE